MDLILIAPRECLTNRWSSRLGSRLSPQVLARKEPWLQVVVGGAAQLYVRWPLIGADSRIGCAYRMLQPIAGDHAKLAVERLWEHCS